MPSSRIDRIADPLNDRFTLDDLASIAPWVAEEIRLVGRAAVCDHITARGGDPRQPQLMATWVGALTALNGPFWEALDVA